ncbi:MAG: ankyrin repeat domain-containing protein [Desulfuromonadales bacterium]
MSRKRVSLDIDRHHPFVTRLIIATQSGDVAKVKRYLKNVIFSGDCAKASSLALGATDPLDNPVMTTDRMWEHTPHNTRKKRSDKRSLRRIWESISRSIGLLLDAGADPDTVDHEGCPVLCKIVHHKELVGILRRLLLAGANPNSHDSTGFSALCNALVSGNEEAVQLLLEHGAHPATQFDSGITLLMFAAGNQQPRIMRRLINAGADLNSRDSKGRTALMHALYKHGDLPFLVVYRWARESHAKRYPETASIGITRMLVESGAEYEKPDDLGFLPVEYALVPHLKGVELPVELIVNRTHLKLCGAAMAGDHQQLALLSQSEEIPSRIKNIALTIVAVRGYEACCKVLLETGADANKPGLYDAGPAESAAIGLQLPIIRLLMDYSLSKEEMNTALKYLCMALPRYYEEEEGTFHSKRLELVRYLLEHGADPNTFDKELGDLLSISTLFEENQELVRLLMDFGAKSQRQDANRLA